VVLYEILTFERPFRGANMAALMQTIQEGASTPALAPTYNHLAPKSHPI